MHDSTDPGSANRINLRDFARRGATLEGEVTLAAMPRLAAALCLGGDELARMHARWTLRGEVRRHASGAEQPRVELEVRAELPMTCQRCLQPSMQVVDECVAFRLVDAEPELTLEELEAEDEALCATQPVDVAELVEDQLILALPLVPMHQPACPRPIERPAQDLPAPESPFAALAAMRRRN